MEAIITVLLFILGILLIVKGGDMFVDSASWIAEISGIPKFIIGATIVSLATTLPELLVSVIATVQGKNDMAVGNAIGSVTANVGLIMGISILCMPAVMKRSKLAFQGILLLVIVALLCLFSLNGSVSSLEGLVLLVFFCVFTWRSIRDAKSSMQKDTQAQEKPSRQEYVKNIAGFIIGAAGIVIGAQLLVDNGSILARMIGVPESIIGVTLIAVGTSLPELVTTITAIVKKQSSLSVGNIVGANIIDSSVILPICSLISKGSLPVSAQSIRLDMPFCLLILAIGLVPALIREKFSRVQGVLLLCTYAVYIFLVCTAGL